MDLQTLRQFKPQINALALEYGLANIRVFGSVARSEENENSDVDFLVTALPGTGLMKLAGFYNSLEDLLKCKVDVITDGPRIDSDGFFQNEIKSDVVPL